MKFLVSKTSETNIKEAFFDNAELIDFDEMGRHKWSVEINSLEQMLSFCANFKEEIILIPPNDDGYWTLEIYDDYRE